MSIRVMSSVWEHSKQKGPALLMLLAIADQANDYGEAYPGVERLAKKCRMKERNAQLILHNLEKSGELQIEMNAGMQTKHGKTNLYRVITPGALQHEMQKITPHQKNGVQKLTPQGVQESTPQGVQKLTPKPLVETLDQTLCIPASVEADTTPEKKEPKKRSTPLPLDFSITPDMRAWAAQNAPNVNLEAATEEFKDDALAKDKRFTDWIAAWRKWIGNARDWGKHKKAGPHQQRIDQAAPATTKIKYTIEEETALLQAKRIGDTNAIKAIEQAARQRIGV